MSSVSASLQGVPRRQYVSTAAFHTRFFTYEKAAVVNGVQRYALAQVSTDPLECPKGHILRENGRKLIKDVNIDLNDPNTTANEYTYLVGVIDTTADPAVSGFIDPNSPVFAPFNTDKPYFLDSPAEAEDASTGLQDIGAPVYTRGDVTAEGQITMGSGFFNQYRSLSEAPAGNTALSTNPASTTQYMVGAIITQTPTVGTNVNLPTTAQLLAVLGTTVGLSFTFSYMNTGSASITLIPSTDTTIGGAIATPAAISATTTGNFVVRVMSATTVKVFRV